MEKIIERHLRKALFLQKPVIKLKKKPKAKTMRNKCDRLWSEIIKSGGSCEICGRPVRDPHHVIGRKNMALRWDIRNGVRLCFQHHTGGKLSAHNDPLWFMDWFKNHRPDDYEYLLKRKNELWNRDYAEVLRILQEVKKL